VTQRGCSRLTTVLSAAEQLLSEEANYGFVVAFLEDVQNLVSHHLETLCGPQEITSGLGPRCATCWSTVADFGESAGAWRGQAGMATESSDKLLSVHNDQLRQLLWTANRTLADGSVLGLADAVRYEKAGGTSIPGYSHVAAARNIAGPG
jgi:hypothetical protein